MSGSDFWRDMAAGLDSAAISEYRQMLKAAFMEASASEAGSVQIVGFRHAPAPAPDPAILEAFRSLQPLSLVVPFARSGLPSDPEGEPGT